MRSADPNGEELGGRAACQCWATALVITLATVVTACGGGDVGRSTGTSTATSVSLPVPAEQVALTARVARVLGPHALQLGEAPTLVIVVEGVPASIRPGVEVQATGSVRVFDDDLGAELGIPLTDPVLERFGGEECLVVARLVLAGR